MNRVFKLVINNEEKESEVRSLLAYISQYLGVEVQEITSMDEEIMEAKKHLHPNEAQALDEILHIFYNNVSVACNFLHSIRGKRQTCITNEVNLLVRERKIAPDSCKTPLWKALNRHGLYSCGQVNWINQIIIPKTLTKLNTDWKQ